MTGRRGERVKVGSRFMLLRIIIIFAGVLLTGRVFQIQVLQHEHYRERAEALWRKEVTTNAERGNFYDRLGRPLALSVTTYKVGVSYGYIKDRGRLSAVLADVLELPVARVRRKIDGGTPPYVCIAPDVVLTGQQRQLLASKGGGAVTMDPLYARVYPYDGVGASYIGFYRPDTVKDITTGLECSLDGLLAGRPGRSKRLLTPRPGKDRGDVILEQARHGQSLTLTMDADLQTICEQRLATAVADYQARGGSVLIMDPRNGDVLAAASWPLMDTRDRSHADARVWQNRNFTQMFEPGSVLKVFTVASLLSHAAIDTATRYNCDNGAGPDIYVRNDGGHDYGLISLMQAIAKSSNVYMAKAVANLTSAEFYRSLTDFGFGRETAAPYPGEANGILRAPAAWSGRSKQTISIGQEISVTAVQLGAALCAAANGGTLYAPRLVCEIRDERGRLVDEIEPTALRRIMSPQLAALLREAMARVVRDGTGQGANVDWIALGGKTGTAQKVREGEVGYSSYVASFGGLVPVDDPRLVVLTVLDEPRGTFHYAAQSAVPMFREIVADIRRSTDWLTDVPGARTASFTAPDAGRLVGVPDVMYLAVGSAASRLAAHGLGMAGAEKEGLVVEQVPAPGTRCAPGTVVNLTVAGAADPRAPGPQPGVCPDFAGLSNREVLRLAARLRIPVEIQGVGYAARQSVRPGQEVSGRAVTVKMKGSRL